MADAVFSNGHDGTSNKINSYIYWGSTTGLSSSSPGKLPTIGATGCAIADLNDDGYPELIFANGNNGSTYYHSSNIYWGSISGYSVNNRTNLPTIGANSVTVAELNYDGYLDLIFNQGGNGTTAKINSYIYWGSSAGYSSSNRTELPTNGTEGNTAADFDKDGRLDLIFSNYSGNAYIYWGKAPAFTASNMTILTTPVTTYQVESADLNGDGWLDLGFGIHYNTSGSTPNHKRNSLIYWGSASGFSSTPTELPTLGAVGVSFAHLNSDDNLDIVFSNFYDGTSYSINSYIYWGSKSGYTKTNRSEYPTVGAYGNLVADFDGDGNQEALFNPYRSQYNYNLDALAYKGTKSGPISTTVSKLPVHSSHHSISTDLGSVYTRRPLHTYTSQIHTSASATPTYLSLSWTAKIPKKTSLKFQVRSAVTTAGLATATWFGPTSSSDYYKTNTSTFPNPTTNSTGTFSLNKIYNGHRYIQYRAIFEQGYDFTNTPVLDTVEICYY